MTDVMDCLNVMNTLVQSAEMRPGGITHSMETLRYAIEKRLEGLPAAVEVPLKLAVEKAGGGWEIFRRQVDVLIAASEGRNQTHVEIKTGDIDRALNAVDLLRDAMFGITGDIDNVWRFTRQISADTGRTIQDRLESVGVEMVQKFGLSRDEVIKSFRNFRFEDEMGNAIEPSLAYLFRPDGPIARAALKHAHGSPDFNPAMQVLFGAQGSMADAATTAAARTDLTGAEQLLEQKVEQSVTAALDDAGKKASAKAAQQLGAQVVAGVGALGSALTAVPQLYDSVTKLGTAWDKPLTTTKDYMDLMSAAGGVLGQGVQTLQALAGVTQIATGAQAAFNLVAMANPVVLVVAAVVALIAAIALLIIYWDEVKAALRDNPWLAVIAALSGIIGLVVVIIAYWDEIKLVALETANEIAQQVERIGQFFGGLGAAVQNLFIGIVNAILTSYNDLAGSALGAVAGLQQATLLAPVATPAGPAAVTSDLENAIAAQQKVVAAAAQQDETRRLAGAAVPSRPAIPAAQAGTPAPVDSSVRVDGGITVNINAERLEADAARLLTDEIVRQLRDRLDALRSENSFRTGARVVAP